MTMALTVDKNGFPIRAEKAPPSNAEIDKKLGVKQATVASGVNNSPITWPQLIGGWMSDAPIFFLAALPLIATWLQSNVAFTIRGLITIAILAIVAGLTAVQRITMTDGLSLRLRAMGQINGGK